LNLLICIPTYNEIENIERFIPAVFAHCPPEAHILVIDDNSPDGTAVAAEQLAGQYPGRLHLLKRPGKQGLAQAYLAAFDWGLARGYDVFLEMDADFSHNPRYIPEMLEKIETHDVVIGSRNIKGGGVEGWTPLRNGISKGGSFYSRVLLGCPMKDLTGGFNMWRKSALEKIGLTTIISRGYSFQIEMKYKAFLAGCSIAEIPILFTDRKQGTSKMSQKILLEALVNIWKIKSGTGRETGLDQFFKFAVTGGLGTITNLVIFFLCADLLNLPEIPVSIGCFLIAVTQNYIINHLWSFRTHTAGAGLSAKRWCMFIASSLFGLAVNVIVMKLILLYWMLPYKFIAQAWGIAAGMVINFILSKYAVFRKEKQNAHT
jgi:dolichol-phosphate mannosyltransferase